MNRGMIGSALIGVWLGCVTATAAQLPPEIQADRHLVRAQRLLAEDKPWAALAEMDKIITLQKEHDLALPEDFHFKHAQVALAAGRAESAIDSVNKYLVGAGRDGEFYREALELLDTAEEKLREAEAELRQAEAERRRIEAERRRVEALQRENADQAKRQIEAASVALARDPLRSGGFGPEMVRVAKGRIQVEVRRPNRRYYLEWVAFESPFAIGKFEVTRGDFERFVKATRYRTEAERGLKLGCDGIYGRRARRNSGLKWDRPGFDQTNTHPVTCVSIRDAMAYARWLSQQTGNRYRLPSHAEWQYAARAGSQWAMLDLGRGDLDDWKAKGWTNHCGQANLEEDSGKHRAHTRCLDGVKRTALVGSHPPNDIGLHDMIGNVAELVLTCVDVDNRSFVFRNPLESIENPNNCEKYVIAEGGSWYHAGIPGFLTSYKTWKYVLVNPKDESVGDDIDDIINRIHRNSTWYVGFRVMRDLQD